MNNQHPLAIELLAAAAYEPGTETIHEHIQECVSCQVDFDLLTKPDDNTDRPDDAATRRILAGAPTLPSALLNSGDVTGQVEPLPGELWRIGNTSVALLAWVSEVVGDIARVVPMLLDVDMADDKSVYVSADVSPLGVDAILLYDLARTVPLSTFLTLIGPVDLPGGTARSERLVEAAPIGDSFAFPIENPHDLRIQPRLEIEDLLEALATTPGPSAVVEWDYEYAFETLRADLKERIFGSDLHPLPRTVFPAPELYALTCLAKVTHLQRSTVVAALSGADPHTAFNAAMLAAPCRDLLRFEPDADAVAVVIPVGIWVTALFTSADTQPALSAPTGSSVGPTTTHLGHGLVDTMHKFLDGRVSAWEDTEATPTRLNIADIHDVVQRNATTAVEGVRKTGSRARTHKKDVWSGLPPTTHEAVAQFVQALLNDTPVADALHDLHASQTTAQGPEQGDGGERTR